MSPPPAPRLRLDANLVPVLQALLVHESVTRAGRELGLTQSATSHALARLRRFFDDPLLVRSGPGLKRTPFAEALAPAARRAADALDDLGARGGSGFSPSSARGAVRIRAPVDVWVRWGGELERRVRERAPEVELVPAGEAADAADLWLSPQPGAEVLLDEPLVLVGDPDAARRVEVAEWSGPSIPSGLPVRRIADTGWARSLLEAPGHVGWIPESVAAAWGFAPVEGPSPVGPRRRLWLHLRADAPPRVRWVAEQLRAAIGG